MELTSLQTYKTGEVYVNAPRSFACQKGQNESWGDCGHLDSCTETGWTQSCLQFTDSMNLRV